MALASRTSGEVAATIGRSAGFVDELFAEDETRGIVERAGDGWRLTAAAAAEYAWALTIIEDAA